MIRTWLVALALASGCTTPARPPAPAEAPSPTEAPAPAGCAAPTPGEAMTPEQCTCLGGRVSLSRGGEQAHCAASERELGTVRFGIEGGWCCKAP